MSEALADRLEQVRRQGCALLAGHVHEDATGEAVPVRDGLGAVVAANSVTSTFAAAVCATPD